MPMHDLESLLEDPHLVATGFFPIVEHPTEGTIHSMKVSARFSETRPSRRGWRRDLASKAKRF